jgi:ADP-ribose pyrophosphatase YjhB (NUDIX family)
MRSGSGSRVTGRRRYNLLRWLGRTVTRTAAAITLEQMPPFVSASAVVTQDDRVLAVVDAILGEPILPGGHLTWRETPEEGCKREIREETGLIVEVDGLSGVYSGEERAGELGVVRLVYRARVTGGTLRSSAEGEAVWLSVADFTRLSIRDGPILLETMTRVSDPELP